MLRYNVWIDALIERKGTFFLIKDTTIKNLWIYVILESSIINSYKYVSVLNYFYYIYLMDRKRELKGFFKDVKRFSNQQVNNSLYSQISIKSSEDNPELEKARRRQGQPSFQNAIRNES